MTRCEFQIKKLYTLPGLCSLAVIFIIMNEMMKRPWTLYSFVGYYKLLEGRGIYEDYGIQLYNYTIIDLRHCYKNCELFFLLDEHIFRIEIDLFKTTLFGSHNILFSTTKTFFYNFFLWHAKNALLTLQYNPLF